MRASTTPTTCRASACPFLAICPDSRATTSVHWLHVARGALVYHRFNDGDLTGNSSRSSATSRGPRPQDAALLVARRGVRGRRRRTVADVRDAQGQEVSILGDPVLS